MSARKKYTIAQLKRQSKAMKASWKRRKALALAVPVAPVTLTNLDVALDTAASFIAGVAHGLAIVASERYAVSHSELAHRVGLALQHSQGGSTRRTRNQVSGV